MIKITGLLLAVVLTIGIIPTLTIAQAQNATTSTNTTTTETNTTLPVAPTQLPVFPEPPQLVKTENITASSDQTNQTEAPGQFQKITPLK